MPDYGTEQRRAIQKALVRAADRSDARFLVHIGDLGANDGRKAYHWSYFLKDNKRYASPVGRLPLLAVPGNHEYINTEYGLRNWQAVVGRPTFYVQDSLSAAIFFLNFNSLVDQHQKIDDALQEELFREWFVSADPSQTPSWLEHQLEKHEDRPFKIVVMHHPPVSFSWHHFDWYEDSFGPDLTQKRGVLIRLFQKHGVQVIFSGHEHLRHRCRGGPAHRSDRAYPHRGTADGGGRSVDSRAVAHPPSDHEIAEEAPVCTPPQSNTSVRHSLQRMLSTLRDVGGALETAVTCSTKRTGFAMKVVITYDPPQGGEDFHEQKLYYVPFEEAREMVSDFQSFQSGREESPACQVYEYDLISIHESTGEHEGSDENANRAEETELEARKGILALDFRKIASIHGFVPYS